MTDTAEPSKRHPLSLQQWKDLKREIETIREADHTLLAVDIATRLASPSGGSPRRQVPSPGAA